MSMIVTSLIVYAISRHQFRRRRGVLQHLSTAVHLFCVTAWEVATILHKDSHVIPHQLPCVPPNLCLIHVSNPLQLPILLILQEKLSGVHCTLGARGREIWDRSPTKSICAYRQWLSSLWGLFQEGVMPRPLQVNVP